MYKKIMILVLSCICISLSVYCASYVIDMAQHPQVFKEWISSFGMYAQLIIFVLVFLQVVFAWLPGELFEVAAGYVFGFWQGSVLVLLASFCASVCIVFFVKRYGYFVLSIFFSKEKIESLTFLKHTSNLYKFIAIAFFIPGSPKDILTYAIGLTNMKITHFLCITTIARLPSVMTSTLTGSALGIENYHMALYSFVFTLVISLFGIVIYRIITHSKQILIEEKLPK